MLTSSGCFLIKEAGARQSSVTLVCYTLDLEDITEALVGATKKGAQVRVIADYGQALGRATRDMAARLQQLRQAGVAVRLCAGTMIQEIYREVGRDVPPGRGIQHAKVLLAGRYMVFGSPNWTTSSKCNVEVAGLVELGPEGQQLMQRELARVDTLSVAFTGDVEARGTTRRLKRARSRERSPSPWGPWSG